MSINLYFCNPVRLKEPVIVKVMTTKTQQIRIEDFDYPLPDERIAKFPLPKRDESKLLLYKEGKVSESIFKHITDYLPEGSLMVFNNTRVIQARLLFQKETGAKIEIFCLEPVEPHDYALVFQQTECCRWTCLVGNLKKWKEGLLKKEVQLDGETVILKAEKLQTCGDSYLIEFTWDHPTCTFADLLDAAGVLPIPPYLNRETEKSDLQTYQTVYSKTPGSAAAPTAGLHFTTELLDALKAKGVKLAFVTLHVGLGTFRPVKEDEITDHIMHSEYYIMDEETAGIINDTRAAGGKIWAVGTTATRTLETIAADDGTVRAQSGWTDIFIYPGYKFKAVDHLVTNFHLPESTLMMLISAFATREMVMNAYQEAIKEEYRFFSFGDSMLLY